MPLVKNDDKWDHFQHFFDECFNNFDAVKLSFSNNRVYEPDNTLAVDDPCNYPDCDIGLELRLDECANNACKNKFHHVCAGEHDVDNYVCYTCSILQEEIKHRAMVVEKDDEVANCVIVQSKKKVHAQRKRRSEVLCGTPGCNRIAWHSGQCDGDVITTRKRRTRQSTNNDSFVYIVKKKSRK